MEIRNNVSPCLFPCEMFWAILAKTLLHYSHLVFHFTILLKGTIHDTQGLSQTEPYPFQLCSWWNLFAVTLTIEWSTLNYGAGQQQGLGWTSSEETATFIPFQSHSFHNILLHRFFWLTSSFLLWCFYYSLCNSFCKYLKHFKSCLGVLSLNLNQGAKDRGCCILYIL